MKKMAAMSVFTTTLGVSGRTQTYRLDPAVKVALPNERVRIATVGMGIIGFIDTRTALRVPGAELVAAADLYEGRRVRTKEVFGDHVDTYVDYREILARDDVDAVLICTPDHWHAQMAKDAMRAGKAVYCEKPVVRTLDEGPDLIEVQKETGQVFQVGSQFGSSVLYYKVQELISSGAIGVLNSVEARMNRNSSIGAWQYSIPTDASPETIDWARFIEPTTPHDFDPIRFFRWRNYWDYGTGVAGDLYVHLLTGIHLATGAMGPTSIVSKGGLRYWKDGRDAPDVLMGLFDYPETEAHPSFTLSLQTNFVDGGGGVTSFRFVGSDGVIEVGWDELQLTRQGIHQHTADEVLQGYNSVQTFSEAQQEAFAQAYHAEQRTTPREDRISEASTFSTPDGYDSRYDHFVHFFNAIRDNGPLVQGPAFAYRAAAPPLISNMSYTENKMFDWDPVRMRLV